MNRNYFASLVLVLFATACGPHQWIASIPGFERADEPAPAPTETGQEPVVVSASVVADGNSGYLEIKVTSQHPLDEYWITADDEVFVAKVDELEDYDLCEWIDKSLSGGGPGGSIIGTLYSCTQACADACSCFQECAELPSDLGIIGTPAALCTAACSQSQAFEGGLTEIEFADTFGDLYSCTPLSCDTSPQFFGNFVEINYPTINTEAQIAVQATSIPPEPIQSNNTQAGTLVSRQTMCRPY